VSIRLSAYLLEVERLGAADLEATLAFLEEAHAVEGPAPFTPQLLDRLAELTRCEEAAYFEVDHQRRILSERITGASSRTPFYGMTDDLWTCTRTVELNQYKVANGAGPVVLADLFSGRLRRSPDFNPNFRAGGWVDEIHVDLDPPRRWRGEVAIYSSADFGRRARMIMQLLRPHLQGLFRAATHRRRLAALDSEATAELTPREREVMLRVADGLSNAEIARALVVERSTIRKHLEHVYEKLGVRSRTAALAKLRADGFPATGQPV
jgi:DNA-binding CsgD family transcriptional regulator